MTNKEIIQGLKAVRTIHNGNYAPQIDEAIKALEIMNDFEGVGMTNEEAVKWLKQIKIVGYQQNLLNHTEAVDMAIKALKQTSYLTDRPCGACQFHTNNGCTKWECVFSEV